MYIYFPKDVVSAYHLLQFLETPLQVDPLTEVDHPDHL